MPQLDLFAPPPLRFDDLMSAPATWQEGVPDLGGPDSKQDCRFVICIRSRFDPDRLSRRELHARGLGFESWRTVEKETSARAWAARIVRLLRSDRTSRTFHGLVVELTAGVLSADSCAGTKAEEGLWLAVQRGLVWWCIDSAENDEPNSIMAVWRFAARPIQPYRH